MCEHIMYNVHNAEMQRRYQWLQTNVASEEKWLINIHEIPYLYITQSFYMLYSLPRSYLGWQTSAQKHVIHDKPNWQKSLIYWFMEAYKGFRILINLCKETKSCIFCRFNSKFFVILFAGFAQMGTTNNCTETALRACDIQIL